MSLSGPGKDYLLKWPHDVFLKVWICCMRQVFLIIKQELQTSLLVSTWGDTVSVLSQTCLQPTAKLFDVGPGPDTTEFQRGMKFTSRWFAILYQTPSLHCHPSAWETANVCSSIPSCKHPEILLTTHKDCSWKNIMIVQKQHLPFMV